jgi:hypothetical protein
MTTIVSKNSFSVRKKLRKRHSEFGKETILVKYCSKYEAMNNSGKFYRDASGNWKLKLINRRRRV